MEACLRKKSRSGKGVTEEHGILNRLTEYCSNLYNYETNRDPRVLDWPQIPDEERHPILREDVEAAIKAMNMAKPCGVDSIPPDIVQIEGEAMMDILASICNKIKKTGKRLATWTQSLVIAITKKCNLLCQVYRTTSLINHPSKVMLKIILNRHQP